MVASTSAPQESLAERVAKIERQNRRLRLATAGLFVTLACGMVAAFRPASRSEAVPQRVVAHEFDLVGPSGRTRAWLGVDKSGVQLDMYDTGGTTIAYLGGGKSGGGSLLLNDAKGTQRAYLGGEPDGGFALFLPGPSDKAGALLRVLRQGLPTLFLSDAAGFQTELGVTQFGASPTGETRRTSAASLMMFDGKKQVIWQAPPQQ